MPDFDGCILKPRFAVFLLRRCPPLTPDHLTPAERTEAETIADELRTAGSLGQFVIDLFFTWNTLTVRDRLAAVHCWDLSIANADPIPCEEAA